MITADDYLEWVRVVDHHGILHLARVDMALGTVLCGSPPVGCTMADRVGAVRLTGRPTPWHVEVCPHCLAVSGPPPAGPVVVDAEPDPKGWGPGTPSGGKVRGKSTE